MRFAWVALLLGALALPMRAASAECWVVCSVRNGDMGIGSTTGGVNTLGCTLTGRKLRIVHRLNPATGRRAYFRTFTGGHWSTTTTWSQFRSAEGLP